MISKSLNDALNAEIGLELFAHHQYVAMAVYFASRSLDRLADFFYRQAEEEKEHGLKIINYLVEVGGTVVIPAVPQPKQDFTSAEELAQAFLDQEKHVTEQFRKMDAQALQEGDYITHEFLQWFHAEQREEMATAAKLLDLIRLAQGNLLLVEAAMGSLFEAQAGGAD